MFKFSNVSNAWKSTILGFLITLLGTAATSYQAGSFSWSGLISFAVPGLILAITNILREEKAKLDKETPAP